MKREEANWRQVSSKCSKQGALIRRPEVASTTRPIADLTKEQTSDTRLLIAERP